MEERQAINDQIKGKVLFLMTRVLHGPAPSPSLG